MAIITAIFESTAGARVAIDAVKARGVEDGSISYVTPDSAPRELDSAAGIGTGTGATLGGILGMGAATFLIPGLGPIAGVGIIAGALAGAGLGAAAGKAADRKADVPKEDLYFYEEALRQGKTVVLIEPRDSDQEIQLRNMLEHAGGRSVESTRREWWITLRDSEREHARSLGHDLGSRETNYRSGFEAALHPETRGRHYEHVATYLESCYPRPCKTEEFRMGFDRGQQYLQARGGREMH